MVATIWTESKVAELRTLAKSGANVVKIAKRLGVTEGALRWRVSTLKIRVTGVDRRFDDQDDCAIRDMAGQGLSWVDIANELGFTRGSVSKRAKKIGIASEFNSGWPLKDDKKLREMAARGRTWGEIARAVGCSVNAACKYGQRHKIVLNKAVRKGRVYKHAKPKEKQHPRRQRKCLGCGDMFPSKWIGNRICKPCSSSRLFQNSGSRFA